MAQSSGLMVLSNNIYTLQACHASFCLLHTLPHQCIIFERQLRMGFDYRYVTYRKLTFLVLPLEKARRARCSVCSLQLFIAIVVVVVIVLLVFHIRNNRVAHTHKRAQGKRKITKTKNQTKSNKIIRKIRHNVCYVHKCSLINNVISVLCALARIKLHTVNTHT